MTLAIIIIALMTLGLAGWSLFRRLRASDLKRLGSLADHVSTPPVAEAPHAILDLPSSHPHYSFSCDIEFRYAETSRPPRGLRPRQGSVEAALYEAVKDLSAQFPLTRKDQLKYELTRVLGSALELPGGRYVVWGECKGVEVDPIQLEAVYDGYQEDVDNERLRRRIEFLGKVFEDPRTATMWWLSQHSDEVDQIDDKSTLFYNVDRRLNQERRPPELTISEDLRAFAAEADPSERFAMGQALHQVYKNLKREEYAKEARRLLPTSDAKVFEDSDDKSAPDADR
jgi:hypothetical protein